MCNTPPSCARERIDEREREKMIWTQRAARFISKCAIKPLSWVSLRGSLSLPIKQKKKREKKERKEIARKVGQSKAYLRIWKFVRRRGRNVSVVSGLWKSRRRNERIIVRSGSFQLISVSLGSLWFTLVRSAAIYFALFSRRFSNSRRIVFRNSSRWMEDKWNQFMVHAGDNEKLSNPFSRK